MTCPAPNLNQCESGAAAVEFALVAPAFIAILFGIICFGAWFATANGVQQLAAEAARASVAGLSDAERGQLARAFVSQHISAYPFLNSSKIQVSTTSGADTYQVSINYDMSGSPIFEYGGMLPLPSSQIQRTAAIQDGGY